MNPEMRTEVERALAGDRIAFEGLIRRFGRVVYARAYALVHHAQEAEDAAQETFLKAWRARSELKDPERFPGWLLSIARNAALDGRRRRRPEPLPPGGAEVPDPGSGEAEQHLVRLEAKVQVRAALETLPEPHRFAVTLRYLQGMDYASIEKAMGLSNGALRGILSRSLQALRRTLRANAPAAGRTAPALD